MRIFAAALALPMLICAAHADEYVNGYTRSNGTYVEPYYKSSPNNSTYDNFSTKGNVNPYTGQEGTRNPYGSSGSSSYGLYGSGSSSFGSNRRW
jgi:hypothetical protein